LAAFNWNNAQPIGNTQEVGNITGLNGYIRIYAQIKNLMNTFQANGFDVWICSASPRDIVTAISPLVGIAADHVMGIPNLIDSNGKLLPRFYGCGPIADGDDSIITYQKGKRCWISKTIFGINAGEYNLEMNPDPSKRPIFVAGDSNTDIFMLQDSIFLKLVLNRNKLELMCNAYDSYLNRWIVHPMFIAPKPQAANYTCSTSTGNDGLPIRNEVRELIANQFDAVHG